RMFVFGGEAPAGTFNQAEAYDARGNGWSSHARMPTARHGLGAAAVAGRIYVISGGPMPGASAAAANEIFVPSSRLSAKSYTESCLPIRGISREKSEHQVPPLNHRKSDSYTAPAAQRRSAGAGISDPEGSGPSPRCRPQALPVRPPRCD